MIQVRLSKLERKINWALVDIHNFVTRYKTPTATEIPPVSGRTLSDEQRAAARQRAREQWITEDRSPAQRIRH